MKKGILIMIFVVLIIVIVAKSTYAWCENNKSENNKNQVIMYNDMFL